MQHGTVALALEPVQTIQRGFEPGSDLFPGDSTLFASVMRSLGYDPSDNSTDIRQFERLNDAALPNATLPEVIIASIAAPGSQVEGTQPRARAVLGYVGPGELTLILKRP